MTDQSASTAVAPIQPGVDLTRDPHYFSINAKQLAVFKATRARGLSDEQVAYALEMGISLGLNPWTNEFYAADGGNGNVLIMVGRDGLLRKAEEFPDYLGYDAGVVHANDEFYRGAPNSEGRTLRERAGVVHAQGHPRDWGPVIGAWAVAERRGRPPRYFYAPLSEYRPTSEAKLRYTPWGGAESVMIEKVPISVVHRTLCNLSGVYLEEEVTRALEVRSGDRVTSPDEERAMVLAVVSELDAPADLRQQLMEAIDRANEQSPASWNIAKVQMTLPGLTEAEIRRELAHIDETYPPVQDAVVVEEPAAAAAEETPEPEEAVGRDALLEQLHELYVKRDALDEGVTDDELEKQIEELEGRLEAAPEEPTDGEGAGGALDA